MRGEERRQRAILMIMEPGDRVPKEHPLRRVKELADAALAQLSPLFDAMYSAIGRPSIPPERLLKALLLMALYTVRSERTVLRAARLQPVVPLVPRHGCGRAELRPSTFSRNRARLLEHDVAREFFTRVVAQARTMQLISDEHFTVDGTLIEAWASLKSFKSKDGNRASRPTTPATRRLTSTARTAATRRMSRRPTPTRSWPRRGTGKEAKLCYSAHALMENRNGLLIEFAVEPADGYAERKSARAMLETALPGEPAHYPGCRQGLRHCDFVAAAAHSRSPRTSRAMRVAPAAPHSTAALPVMPATR